MRRSTRIWFAVAFTLFSVCFVAAVAAVAAYYDQSNGINYGTAIGFNVVWIGLRSAPTEALGRAFTIREWVLAACVGSGLLAFFLTWNKQRSAVRCAVFAAHVLALPWGWLGILAVPYTVYLGVDGEWLGEHFPTLIVSGLWLLCALAMLATSWDRDWFRRRADHGVTRNAV